MRWPRPCPPRGRRLGSAADHVARCSCNVVTVRLPSGRLLTARLASGRFVDGFPNKRNSFIVGVNERKSCKFSTQNLVAPTACAGRGHQHQKHLGGGATAVGDAAGGHAAIEFAGRCARRRALVRAHPARVRGRRTRGGRCWRRWNGWRRRCPIAPRRSRRCAAWMAAGSPSASSARRNISRRSRWRRSSAPIPMSKCGSPSATGRRLSPRWSVSISISR